MSKKDIENANFEDTGYSYTLSLIAGKYKPNINLQIITSIKIIPIRSGQIHISHIGGSEFVMGGKFPPYTFPKPGV